jgi:hypothetical protein
VIKQAAPKTLADATRLVRSKNAGPFWITIDIFFDTSAGYRAHHRAITRARMASVYGVPATSVRIFGIPWLRVIKVSFPRPLAQGGPFERDMHAGQLHVPLLSMPLPADPEDAPSEPAGEAEVLDTIPL